VTFEDFAHHMKQVGITVIKKGEVLVEIDETCELRSFVFYRVPGQYTCAMTVSHNEYWRNQRELRALEKSYHF